MGTYGSELLLSFFFFFPCICAPLPLLYCVCENLRMWQSSRVGESVKLLARVITLALCTLWISAEGWPAQFMNLQACYSGLQRSGQGNVFHLI